MRKFKGLLYTVIVVAMLGCLSGCNFGWKTNYVYENGDKYTAGDCTIAEKIETIDVNYLSGDVKLIGTDSDTISIKETSDKQLSEQQKVHTWVDGTTLYVRYCASAKGLDLNNLNKHLEITIPEDVKLSDVNVKDSSGDVECQNFEAENANVSVSSGHVTIGCEVGKIKVHASSGNIMFEQQGDSEEIDLSSSSGKINVTMENAEKVSISASSGNVKIAANEIKDFHSKISSGTGEYRFVKVPGKTDISQSSGDVTLYLPKDADLTGDFHLSSGKLFYELAFAKNGDSYVCGTGANQMKVHVSSGNVDIKATSAE